MSETLKVGDKLWFKAMVGWRRDEEVTVERVGRKWLHISNGDRCDRETLLADGRGYSPPGKLWQSKDEYDRHANRLDRWSEFQRKVTGLYSPPEHVSIADIDRMLTILEPE